MARRDEAERIKRAERAYRRFHWGDEPRELIEATAPIVEPGDVLWSLGALVDLTYEASKDGKIFHWHHEFKRTRPTLALTERARLVIVGGSYRVTGRGIVG